MRQVFATKMKLNYWKVGDDVDRVYVGKVLPGKMKYNLEAIKKFSFFYDIATMFRTVFAVLGKEYK